MTWVAACPVCDAALGPFDGRDQLHCEHCGHDWSRVHRVWRMVPPARADDVAAFLDGYNTVRQGEGRGSDDSDWHRTLPHTQRDDPMAHQWQMRARSFHHLRRRFELDRGGRTVLDIGAGNGWLSHRLRKMGHHPLSIDVAVDERDGLRAAVRHLDADWPVVQAHFDHLPLMPGQADLCIFNASLHYSTDLAVTLRSARRQLRPGGRVVVIDSPVYRHDVHGRQMVAERAAEFERRFGTRSDAVPAVGFLTRQSMIDAGRAAGLQWRAHRPWYGWRWAWRPWAARLRRRRRPSRFIVWVGAVART